MIEKVKCLSCRNRDVTSSKDTGSKHTSQCFYGHNWFMNISVVNGKQGCRDYEGDEGDQE